MKELKRNTLPWILTSKLQSCNFVTRMFNKSPLFRRWVETSDRNKTKEQDPKKRKGHFFFKFESLPAKELWHKTLKSVLDNLKVKPEKLKEDDIRTCFNVSLSTDMWESLANSPQVNYIVQTLLQLRNQLVKIPCRKDMSSSWSRSPICMRENSLLRAQM